MRGRLRGDPQLRYGGVVKIEKGRRVRLKARLAVEGGEVIEESVVEYFHGAGTMLAGIEKVLEGVEKGTKKKGSIPPHDAFGNEDQQPIKKIPRAEFPADAQLEVGSSFAAKGVNGQDVLLKVVKADDKEVEVRLVHPLAEKTITYDVEVLSVTDPTPPPLPVAALKLSESEADG
jgi:FKBP-type peptidyl-prolyl cis-trans isomerase 2